MALPSILKIKKTGSIILAYSFTAALFTALLYYFYKLPLFLALADACIHVTLLAIITLALINAFKYYRPGPAYWLVAFLAPVPLVFLWQKTAAFLVLQFPGVQLHEGFLQSTLVYRYSVAYIFLAASAGWALLWGELQRQKSGQLLKVETQQLAREAELYKLRQQLQPHFLFNALNSINALMVTRQKEARQMLLKLSDFLRTTVSRQDETLIPLAEELKHLQMYLAIEQTRFGHRLQVNQQVDKTCLDLNIPPLLLQPLIENAIKFGLYGTLEFANISIVAQPKPNQLQLKISNPFTPEGSLPTGTGFGLKGLKRRLFLLYGRTDLLQTELKNQTFTATLTIPQK